MNKKRLIIIIILTIIISIVLYILTGVYEKSYDKRIKKEKEEIYNIQKQYDDFQKNMENTVDKRDSIYKDLKDFYSYYDAIESDYSSAVKLFKEYEELLKKTEESGKYLKEKCGSYDYMSSDVTTKCYAFSRNYEQAINSFIDDVYVFNLKIKDYNTWIKNTSKKQLEEYQTEYKDYIDYDKDGKYLGKNMD